MITIALLAAGSSQRFGQQCKLQAHFRDKPLVRHSADAILKTGLQAIAVVSDPEVAALLPEFKCIFSRGPKSQTLRTAIASVTEGDVLVVLGDMPFIDTDILRTLAALKTPAALTDGVDVYPPALLTRDLFDEVAHLKGDQGAGKLLRQVSNTQLITVSAHTLVDIDTAADLNAYA